MFLISMLRSRRFIVVLYVYWELSRSCFVSKPLMNTAPDSFFFCMYKRGIELFPGHRNVTLSPKIAVKFLVSVPSPAQTQDQNTVYIIQTICDWYVDKTFFHWLSVSVSHLKIYIYRICSYIQKIQKLSVNWKRGVYRKIKDVSFKIIWYKDVL